MPYDMETADRVRRALERRAGLVEKKMFGGIGFLLHGNLCCAVWQSFLIARVGPDAYEACLKLPGTGEFDLTGRPMKGWVMVAPNGFPDAAALKKWVDRAAKFASGLPRK